MMRGFIFLALLFLANAAHAANDSAYSDFNPDACKVVEPAAIEGEGAYGPTVECKGYKDIAVTFAEDDLRSFVAFGRNGSKHCAFRQTFSGFNSVGSRIEWRLRDSKAIAAILRWKVSFDPEDSTKIKDWLVVTKLDDGESCQIGYVDGAYPKANEKARWLADTSAETFSCKVDKPVIFANPGTVADVTPATVCEE
jgi:hypothetical protein